jgi:hypothetical protein
MRILIASSALAALMLAAPLTASAQVSGSAPFCLKKAETQATNCAYQTMAQCEEAKKGTTMDQCVPRSATTGEGPGTGRAPAGGMAPSQSR